MMYTEVYQQMVSSGIAHKLDTPVRLNKNSKIVELEEEAFGLKTEYLLHHPSKLIFIDEVGSNTSQTKDGNYRGKKFIVPNDIWLQIKAATKDSHLTVLGFTAATGEPIMCAFIFAAKELDPAWVLHMDPFFTWVSKTDNIEENTGKGKVYPMGPDCNF